jgi:hypothetical protein
MTLNSSGPISLGGSTAGQSINLELSQSATAQVSLNDANVRSLAGVASGAIIMPTNFYGKSAVVISLTSQNAFDFSGGARNATAGYRLTSGGLAQILENLTFTTVETWCTPTGEAVNYEALVDNITGSGLTTGTTGVWVALSTTQTWTLVATPGNGEITTFDVSVRRAGTTTVLDTATIYLEADAQF